MSALIAMGYLLTLQTGAAAADAGSSLTQCREDSSGFCADKVLHYALSFDEKDPVIKINSAILIGTTIDISPPLRLAREPTISAKEFLKLEGHEAWKTAKGGLALKVQVLAPPDVDKDFNMAQLAKRRAKIELAFDCGVTLLVTLKIVRQHPERDVARLVLSMPELEKQEAWAQRRVAELARQWTTEIDARREQLDAEVAERVPYDRALAKLRHDDCHELIKTRSVNRVTLMTRRICRVGSQIEVRFRLLSRNKSISFVVGEVVFTGTKAEKRKGYLLLDQDRPAHDVHLKFNEPVEGIAWWPVKGSSKGALKVTDDTGQRSIAVPDIEY